MKHKLRNIVFSSLIAFVLIGPALFYIAEKVSLPIPQELSNSEAKYLVGGGSSNLDPLELFSPKWFISKDFQNAFESNLDNVIPAKPIALLGSSEIQRGMISISNSLFGYKCYPTFYGSSILYIPESRALARMPVQNSNNYLKNLNLFAEEFKKYTSRYTDVNFHIVVADISEYSSSNPGLNLVSNALCTKDGLSLLKTKLDDALNVSVSGIAYSDAEAYYHDYYRSDHHWNGYGAYRSYLATKGLDPQDSLKEDTELHGLIMNGSNSREGLMLLNVAVDEPYFSLPINVEEGDTPDFLLGNAVEELETDPLRAEFDFYHRWYGESASIKTKNENADDGSALVICDSFGVAFQWMVASDYENTTSIYDLRDTNSGDAELADTIDTASYSDIYLVGHIGNFATMLERWPNYLK